MGLCKCPKRRVTNQFCFEHRVNVCEHCMVTSHPKCVIQSYLQWLQDSDYNPICELCTNNLVDGECIRLVCYHVFHWSCAESHYRALPRTTAPAGYQCPSCASSLFPAPNLVSPVADILRERLAGVNWARSALGLPLLSEDQDSKGARSQSPSEPNGFLNNHIDSSSVGSSTPQRATPVGASDDEAMATADGRSQRSHSVVDIDDVGSRRSELVSQGSRRGFQSLEQSPLLNSFDHDENKYKNKSTFAWIVRWWKNSLPSSRARHLNRRYCILLTVVSGVLVVLFLLSHMERRLDDDPFGALPDDNIRVLQKN